MQNICTMMESCTIVSVQEDHQLILCSLTHVNRHVCLHIIHKCIVYKQCI